MADAELRIFLIADVRGYTSFTQRHGDEMAAKLAGKFAKVAREVVGSHAGQVLELRGDEALCVFVSPRQAVRAAVDLQRRFVDETRWDPELPLPVGIGLDIGEAVPIEDGYRSGALNFAARLCSIAKPGEILASQELTHLARRIDGMAYVVGAPVRFKGLAEPARPVRVVPDGENPVLQLIALGALPPRPERLSGPDWLPRPLRRRPWLGLVAGLTAVLLVAALTVVLRDDATGLRELSENVAAAVDPTSGRLLGETPVGAAPSAVVFGAGAVWVANAEDGTVSRIDPGSRQVEQTIEVGSRPSGLAYGDGTVWVANSGSGSLSAIDTDSNRATTLAAGSGPTGLAYDKGVVWVADVTASSLLRVDVATATVKTVARVGEAPVSVAVLDGHVWVSNSGSGTVTEYDPETQSVVQSPNVGTDPRGIAAVDGDLWVVNNLAGTVSRIDPTSGDAVTTLPVGAGPVAVAGSGDTVWVAAETAGVLTQIDGMRGQVVRQVPTASLPTALAMDHDKFWATAASNPGLHRGGTLSVRLPDTPSLDPARGYFEQSVEVDSLMYDGLLSLRRVAGAAGNSLVPDLAVSLPTVSDDGLTYTFRLRPGIRWSDGRPVTGEDIRRGLERAVAAPSEQNGWPLYDGISGADACTPKACDLSRGIAADPATGTVTIRLAAPDPEFPYKLALLGAVAVPASTPLGPLGDRVLPSTGPYRVASVKGATVELVRNPRFTSWVPWRPDGYVDRIVVTVDQSGTAPPDPDTDWTAMSSGPGLAQLRARFGQRVRVTRSTQVMQLALNTTVPPFDDVRARRAVAFALDREAVAAAWPAPGDITCQLVAPGIPGYHPYCPYTLRRDRTGSWHELDLLTAQRLVRASRTRGDHVVVLAPKSLEKAFVPVVHALHSIDYHVDFRATGELAHFAVFPQRFLDGTAHVAFDGWGADYPSASNYIQEQMTCASRITPKGGGSGGFSLFCDKGLDRRVAAALTLQAKDPAAADKSWARLDRESTDKAPFVPLLTLNSVDIVSPRLHNFQRNPILNALFDQAWVR